MDKLKRMILCAIPADACNLHCHYCYVSHRPIGKRQKANFIYQPDYVAKAFTKERLGGTCYFNFCADGETLMVKDIEAYMKAIVEEGHYIEIVTNMTITSVVNKILEWPSVILKRTELKCSLHYLELKRMKMLELFAQNVSNAWAAGASASIEITPSDELIPYIDDVITFSMDNFGALPQLTIARDDTTKDIDYLTKLTQNEYDRTWSVFDSPFWHFKQSIFKVKRKEFCYAGMFALFVNLTTGETGQCYKCNFYQNIFHDLAKPIRFLPIGRCLHPHCYNGHALLAMGNIPGKFNNVRFGSDIRNRIRTDGSHWLTDELCDFFDDRCDDNNPLLSKSQELYFLMLGRLYGLMHSIKKVRRFCFKVARRLCL